MCPHSLATNSPQSFSGSERLHRGAGLLLDSHSIQLLELMRAGQWWSSLEAGQPKVLRQEKAKA